MLETATIVSTIGVFTAAYLAGSINFSIMAARLLGFGDLRAEGSKNAGATNLSRVAGKPAAAVVLVSDLARAFAVVYGAGALLPNTLAPLAALFLLLGNIFPVFHRFKGGKGVAAAVGIVLAMNPPAMLAGGGLFLVVFGISRRVSPASLTMVASYPLWFHLFGCNPYEIGVASVLAATIWVTHRGNIGRLFRGAEPALGAGKGPRAKGGSSEHP